MTGKKFDISKFASTIKPVPDSDTAWIDRGGIYLNPKNFYPKPDPKALDDLAESIDANGILEPPTVVRDGEQFRLMYAFVSRSASSARIQLGFTR